VLVAGDSTGVGTGSVDNTKSIAGRIGADFPRVDITNVSVNGLKLIGLVDILQKNNEQYDLVVFQIGANDVTGRTPYADIHAQLAQALQWSDTHARHTVVLTAGNVGSSPVFYWPFSTYITQRTLATRALFMQLVGEHSSAQYIDLYQPRKRDVFVQDPATYFAADHFHPSAAGYGVWYQSVGPQIAGIL
jgi:lysophospholipase L1-like esterase